MPRSPSEVLDQPAKRGLAPKPQLPSKRKRDTICALGAFNQPFTIKPPTQSSYEKPVTFKPVRIIARSQLPLTFLDSFPDENLPANNRHFFAYIDVLEQHHEDREKDKKAPVVLIARYESKRLFYAIERVQKNIYSLCKLAHWLKEKDVSDMWDPSSLSYFTTPSKPRAVEGEPKQWWSGAAVSAGSEETPAKRVKMSMLRPKPKAQLIPTEAAADEAHQNLVDAISCGPSNMEIEMPSPQEQLEALVQQYLVTVYLSKTSLAYFAKGPVTRIRTTFTSPEEGAPSTEELKAFLKTMLLSHRSSDKKYRTKLPEIIKSIPPGFLSDEDEVQGTTKPKKKKKAKINRDGVYPQEEEYVRKWWTAELPNTETYGDETLDNRIKRRIGDLRVRETLAQMIIMLEIVALEALCSQKDAQNEKDAAEEESSTKEPQTKAATRKKKLEDINVQLDLLLDKLCIWQSIDEAGILDFDSKPSGQGADKSNDRLQGFCVEVIVPFYMNRLPEQAKMINKKLGGPVQSSPPKRKAMRPPTTSRKSGGSKEPDAKKSRRSFGRVATDTTAQTSQQRATPSLNRSTTDSALLHGIKREVSEQPLAGIPFQRSPSNASRQSMSQFKHMKGRQIDLSTPSAAATAKLLQKKRVEEELNEAITALKKPNRGLAAGSYADELDKRGPSRTNKSRKPAVTVRKITKDVQVSATPAVRRTKDFVEQTPLRNPFMRNNETDVSPPSSACIPSSAVRPGSTVAPGTARRSATARNLAGAGVAETPSKAPNTKAPSFSSGTARRAIFETPLKTRASPPLPKVNSTTLNLFATPTKGTSSTTPTKIVDTPAAVLATPSRGAAPADGASMAAAVSPTHKTSSKGQDDEEPDIYAAMGWNDDDDLF